MNYEHYNTVYLPQSLLSLIHIIKAHPFYEIISLVAKLLKLFPLDELLTRKPLLITNLDSFAELSPSTLSDLLQQQLYQG